jgi:secreted PhoX family phosphatase
MRSALHETEQRQQAGELAAGVLDRRTTRRTFIRGITAAGASSVIAATLDRTGVVDLFGETALAGNGKKRKKKHPACSLFAEFTAIAPSPADALQVPTGFRAQVILRHGDTFKNGNGDLTFGFNNDWIGYFPLDGSSEGLLFVNHEYPGPFYQHGFKPLAPLRRRRPSRCSWSRTRSATRSSTCVASRTASGRSSRRRCTTAGSTATGRSSRSPALAKATRARP